MRSLLCIVFTLWQAGAFKPTLTKRMQFNRLDMIDTGRNLKLDVDGGSLCYDLLKPKNLEGSPILYLPGLIREKNEAKSASLQAWCKKSDYLFLCADYFGVGRSSGSFVDGSVGRWAADTITLIEKTVARQYGKVVLVGHGVGTWISFLVASKRPDLVGGIVGLSADPDFTEELLWKKLPEDVKATIMEKGVCEITWGKEKYPISRNLIEDGRKNLILTGTPGSIPVKCPVRLIHALHDEEVPFSLALQLVENIQSADASVVLLKTSTHAMEGEDDMRTTRSMILEVMSACKEGDYDLTSPGSG